MSLIKSVKPPKVQMTWSNGKLVRGMVSSSSLNFVMHYGAPAVWEGIRSYKSASGETAILCLGEHISRLFDSAKIMGIDIPFSKAEILEGCKAVVSANGGGDLYLRPIIYTSQSAEIVQSQNCPVLVDIYAFPMPHSFSKTGLRLGISNIVRGYPQYDMQAKATCNYKHLHLCQIEKKNRGVDDMLLLDNQGFVVEATVANLFVLKNKVLMTPPNNGSILPGVTRQNVITMFQNSEFQLRGNAHNFPMGVFEKNITRSDIFSADEVFLCGTYAEIVPVLEVENRVIGDGSIGKFTKLLMSEYEEVARGKSSRHQIHLMRIGK